MSCCGSTRIVSAGLANCDFNVTSGDSPTNVLSGPEVVGCNDTLHLWSAGGIDFSVTPGSARVNIEPANITDDIANPGAPASPPADVTRPAVHFAQDGIWVWDTVGATWALSATASGPSTNIYNADGTLAGNRVVSGGASSLTFDTINFFTINAIQDIVLNGFPIQFSQYFDTRDDTGAFTPANFLYTNASGDVLSAPLTALPAPPADGNIYDNDGALNANRNVDGQNNSITWENVDTWEFLGTSYDATTTGNYQVAAAGLIELETTTTNGIALNSGGQININGDPVFFNDYPFSRDDTGTNAIQNILYTGPFGILQSAPIAALAAVLPSGGNTIYTADDFLTGDRVLDGSNNNLTFDNIDTFDMNAVNLNTAITNQITLAAVGPSGGITLQTVSSNILLNSAQRIDLDGDPVVFNQYPESRDDTPFTTPQNFLYTDSSGFLNSAPISSISGSNIYTTDGVLTGNRLVDGAGNELDFDNLNNFRVGQSAATDNIFLQAGDAFGPGTGGSLQLSFTAQTILRSNNTSIVLQANGSDYFFSDLEASFAPYPETRDDTAIDTPQNFLYTTASGNLRSGPITAISGANIYTTDGALTGPRIVNGNGNDLTFSNMGAFAVNTSGFNASFDLAGNDFVITNTTAVTINAGNLDLNGTQIIATNYPSTRDDTGTFAPQNFLYTDNSGNVFSAPLTALPGGNTIYTADDTLTGNRTLLGGGNSLNLLGLNQFNVDGTGNVSIVGDGNVTLQSDNGIATLSGDTQTLVTSGGPLNIAATGSGPINMQTVSPQPINILPGGGGDVNIGSQVGFLGNQVRIRSQGASSDYNVIIGDNVQRLATDVDTGQLQPDAGNIKAIAHHSGTQNLRVDVTGLTDFMWFEIRAAGTFTAGIGGGSAIYRAHYNPFTGAVTVEESAANGDVSLAFAGAVAGSLAFTFTPVPAGTGMRKTLELHMYGTELADEINVNFSAI